MPQAHLTHPAPALESSVLQELGFLWENCSNDPRPGCSMCSLLLGTVFPGTLSGES